MSPWAVSSCGETLIHDLPNRLLGAVRCPSTTLGSPLVSPGDAGCMGRPASQSEPPGRPSAVSAFESVDGEPQRIRNFFMAAELFHVLDR
jgi:hypothetical protein